MNKVINKDNLKKLTVLFLFLMPIFDTIFFYSKITTLIRIIFIVLIFILTIILYKDSHKHLKYLLIYFFVVLLYFIIDYYHSLGFTSLIPGNFSYNGYTELLTIIKLMIPITLIYSLYYQKLSKKDYYFIIKSWILLISLSIIVLNIFKYSLSSYSTDIIKYNIFEWHKGLYYIYTASRGLFIYPNQEAIIILMLLVLETYDVITSKKINILYIILLTITCLILGTRVSSFGGLLLLIFILLLYIIYSLINKEKISHNIYLFIIPIIIWILLLPISPYSNRNIELNKVNTKENIISNNIENNNETTYIFIENNKMQYVDQNHDNSKLPTVFYQKYYSYQYDSDFWYVFVQYTPNNKLNYRYIETSIIKRVMQIDNRKTDYLFGISNTRIQHIVNIERDFVEQFYAFGIIGSIILLFIYPLSLFLLIKNYLKDKSYFNLLLIINCLIFVFVSYLTGNILNSITTTIPYAILTNHNILQNKTKKIVK
jgi:hypothetical protein